MSKTPSQPQEAEAERVTQRILAKDQLDTVRYYVEDTSCVLLSMGHSAGCSRIAPSTTRRFPGISGGGCSCC